MSEGAHGTEEPPKRCSGIGLKAESHQIHLMSVLPTTGMSGTAGQGPQVRTGSPWQATQEAIHWLPDLELLHQSDKRRDLGDRTVFFNSSEGFTSDFDIISRVVLLKITRLALQARRLYTSPGSAFSSYAFLERPEATSTNRPSTLD